MPAFAPLSGRELALRTRFVFATRGGGASIEVVALRRPELVVRRTRYDRLIVDERVLTRAFPVIAPPSRLFSLALIEGRIRFHLEDRVLEVAPGDVVLLRPSMTSRACFERAFFVDLEWTTDDAARLEAPRLVGRAARAELASFADSLADETLPHRELLAQGFACFANAGVPLGPLDAAALRGGPSVREERIARAIQGQLRELGTAASSLNLAEVAELSPRQLQRVVEDLAARYGINAGNWRDMRNRWRIQIGAVLLSVPELTLSEIAAEVGYASPAALARAFAHAGLPPPSELRAALT